MMSFVATSDFKKERLQFTKQIFAAFIFTTAILALSYTETGSCPYYVEWAFGENIVLLYFSHSLYKASWKKEGF